MLHPEVRKFLSEIGKKGGAKTSAKKAEACRKNAGKDPLIARIQAERGCSRQRASILAQRERAASALKETYAAQRERAKVGKTKGKKSSSPKKQRAKIAAVQATADRPGGVAQVVRATVS